jgi:hypothetical protein
MISKKLLAALLATTLLGTAGCGKKKKKDGGVVLTTYTATEADEDTLLNRAVPTGALVIDSVDILGVAEQSGAGLRLAPSDYDADRARISLFDPSMESLKQVSGILCFFNQAAYINMVGRGAYLAQADLDKCFDQGGGSVGSQGQSAGKQKNLTPLWVESSRISERHPLVVKAWFELNEGQKGQDTLMQVKMVIAEGQSEQNPLGIFRLTWEGQDAAGQAMIQGFIEAKRSPQNGKISLNMAEQMGEGEQSTSILMAAVLDYDAALGEVTGGVIRSKFPYWDAQSQGTTDAEEGGSSGSISTAEYVAAYNEARFLRKNVGTNQQACLAKDEFDFNVWRYGLYNATSGARVNLNSGFPLTWQDNGETQYGWAGYWGVWLGEKDVTDGMKVNRIDYETGATSEYSVKVSPGKLIKRTKESIVLAKLDGVEFGTGSDVIAYDATSNSLKKVGSYGENGRIEYMTPTAYIPEVYGNSDKQALNFYSQALGGMVVIYVNGSGAIVGTDAFYYKEENVTGSLTQALTLYCYSNCLKPNISDDQDATFPVNYDDWANIVTNSQQQYTFNPATLELTHAGGSVKLAAGANISSWGFQSGPMVTTPLPADGNPWGLYESPEYYIWETGKNSYNRFVALLDASGNNVNFEPPLFIKYTHSQAADRSGQVGSKYYNKPYLLQYEGFGNLWGIPAGPDANGFWKAEFALKDGTVLGDAKQYKVKALDLELALREKPTSECGALNLSTPDLPAISTFVSPNNGARPVVTGAPAVVEGVVKID